MPVSVIVGMQWGDEGKGKIVDTLSEGIDIVVRCQGGANAGHTVVLGDDIYKLHVVPSGILREGVTSVIGNGVVIDPFGLVAELEMLAEKGIATADRLLLSDRVHLVMPYHCVLDGLHESNLGNKKIGTTGRGIGPAYADKAARTSLRGHDLQNKDSFLGKARELLHLKNKTIAFLGGQSLEVEDTLQRLEIACAKIAPLLTDTVAFLHQAYADEKKILLEGAQGTQLDLDFGTYPYVTSSNTTGGGFLTGSGLPLSAINEVNGVFKAFTTRVGEGPFISEVAEDVALHLRGSGRHQWDEFGTTTGRPRRCGWCDLVIGRFAARLNGITHLHLTKLDVLAGLDELQICTGYRLNGAVVESLPAAIEKLEKCVPVYKTLPGWSEPLAEIKEFSALPENAKNYITTVFKGLELQHGTVSVGPRRDQNIVFAG